MGHLSSSWFARRRMVTSGRDDDVRASSRPNERLTSPAAILPEQICSLELPLRLKAHEVHVRASLMSSKIYGRKRFGI